MMRKQQIMLILGGAAAVLILGGLVWLAHAPVMPPRKRSNKQSPMIGSAAQFWAGRVLLPLVLLSLSPSGGGAEYGRAANFLPPDETPIGSAVPVGSAMPVGSTAPEAAPAEPRPFPPLSRLWITVPWKGIF